MEMVKGETIIVRQKYNLFDSEMEGQSGIYIKTTSFGKHLVYFPQVEEWGEIQEIERVQEGVVEEHNKEIVSRIKTLEYTADEKLKKELESKNA